MFGSSVCTCAVSWRHGAGRLACAHIRARSAACGSETLRCGDACARKISRCVTPCPWYFQCQLSD
eukprot:6892738-Heterocapsa_arctica.AAC.1